MAKFLIASAVALSAFCCVLLADQTEVTKSTGAHPGSTGAPGEITCATAGCHADAIISPGDGKNSLKLGNETNSYTPGQTYEMKLRIDDPGTMRFGFEIVALDRNNASVGEFKITNSTRTQILQNTFDNGLTRKYVTHKLLGTAPVEPGVGEWSFAWTAPEDYRDTVKFYYMTNAANNDNTNKFDQLYKSLAAFAAREGHTSSVNEGELQDSTFSVYPNPASSVLNVTYRVEEADEVRIIISDLRGRTIRTVTPGVKQAAVYTEKIGLDGIGPGSYWLLLKIGAKSQMKKFIVQR